MTSNAQGRQATEALEGPDLGANLSLLADDALRPWRGLPVHWLRTPEGAWNHRFSTVKAGVVLLDTGHLTTRMSTLGRSTDLDIGAGALALFDAGVETRVRQVGARHARRILVDLDFTVLAGRGLLDDDLVSAPLRASPEFHDDALAAVLRQMVHEIDSGCPNGALFAESLSLGVAMHLCRTRSARPPPADRERGRLGEWQWARVSELIACELASDLSLSTLADALGLSKPHFVRLFRNTTGTSPHRYVMQKRIERARQLIQASDASLVDIALEVGFASQSHLHRIFRKTYGVTPGDARRQSGG